MQPRTTSASEQTCLPWGMPFSSPRVAGAHHGTRSHDVAGSQRSAHPGGRASRPRVVRSRLIPAPAPWVWEVVGNLRRHEDLIPLTSVDAPDRPTRVGDRITATSAHVLVDRMVTTRVRERGMDPHSPGWARWARWATFRKTGPLLVGEAHLLVSARSASSCLVIWAEDVDTAHGAALLRLPVDLSLGLMCDLALLRLDLLVRGERRAERRAVGRADGGAETEADPGQTSPTG